MGEKFSLEGSYLVGNTASKSFLMCYGNTGYDF